MSKPTPLPVAARSIHICLLTLLALQLTVGAHLHGASAPADGGALVEAILAPLSVLGHATRSLWSATHQWIGILLPLLALLHAWRSWKHAQGSAHVWTSGLWLLCSLLCLQSIIGFLQTGQDSLGWPIWHTCLAFTTFGLAAMLLMATPPLSADKWLTSAGIGGLIAAGVLAASWTVSRLWHPTATPQPHQIPYANWIALGAGVILAGVPLLHWISSIFGIRRVFMPKTRPARMHGWIMLILLLAQAGLGSAVRHFPAGHAIWDAPLNQGGVMPAMNQQKLNAKTDEIRKAAEHDLRLGLHDSPVVKTWQRIKRNAILKTPDQLELPVAAVHLHFTHRFVAWLILLNGIGWSLTLIKRREMLGLLSWWPAALVSALSLQIALGLIVVWSGVHPIISSAHLSGGALLTAISAALSWKVASGSQRTSPSPK